MSNSRESKLEAFGKLLDVLDELREKCPWDKKQTNESLRCNTIEEVYELSQALLDDNSENIKKELGDVLLHIIFYAKIADEKNKFDIYRHPHVFGSGHAETSAQVEQNWEQLKLKEKGGNKRVLDGVPAALPSLIKAERIQEKAANYGFDWEKKEDVWTKVKEELTEVQAEMTNGNAEKLESEFGDFLFSLINAARLYKVNIDNALEQTNRKFIHRFNYIETQSELKGKKLKEMSLSEMDALWNEAKALEKNRK